MDKKYVHSFLNDGLIYMNNINYFRKLESTDIALRGDPNEGLAASFQAEKMILELNGRTIKDLVGKLDLRIENNDNINIYSMTKISDGKIFEAGDSGLFLSRNFLEFGDRAIAITNINEFEKRLKAAMLKAPDIEPLYEDRVIARQVNYLCHNGHHREMDIFSKFDSYSWQYEWRFAFRTRLVKGAYSLRLGNLLDIAHVFETEFLLNNPLKFVQLE